MRVVTSILYSIDYGNSKYGYWSCEDMVLQLEGCVDVLKAINGDKFDYCFLFDHSNGHDRLRQDGFNANKINKYFGGKQSKMKDGRIIDKTYLGPYEHGKKLKIGDTQTMAQAVDQDGPCYMSDNTKEAKIYKRS